MHDRLQSAVCARLLKVLAAPTRLGIVQCLRGGAMNVNELATLLDMKPSTVSSQLCILAEAGMVRKDRQGHFSIYRLHPAVFRPKGPSNDTDAIDLGCCRLELTGE